MFVTWEDFEDWQEEETMRELENEFTHYLDFHAWEEELLTPAPGSVRLAAEFAADDNHLTPPPP
jgi:hypothetical protein